MVKMLAKQEEEGKVRKRKVDQLDATNKQPTAPECPVCLERMMPPTKIFGCINGHHICETCKSGLNPLLCPKCRKTITGRASDMENFLKELLASTSKRRQENKEGKVEILNAESINPDEEPEAGTSRTRSRTRSSRTSSKFRGSCPLCNLVFERLRELEIHANTCDG